MERTYKEIELPVTGHKVKVYDYYLRGDRIAIEKIMTDAVQVSGSGEVTTVDTGYKYAMEDEAVLRGIESFTIDGEEVSPTKEIIYELPEKDYEEIRDNLPKQKGKNLTTRQSEDISEKAQKSEE